MPDLAPSIALLQAQVDRLAADLAADRHYPRLQLGAPDLVRDKERELASHFEALAIIKQHQATAS